MSTKSQDELSISLISEIQATIAPFEQAVASDLVAEPQNSYQAHLSITQLALLAADWSVLGAKKIIVAPDNAANLQKLHTLLTGWEDTLGHKREWQVVSHQLSDQERNGDVYTQLSQAYHAALYYEDLSHNIIIAASAAKALPDKKSYQASCQLLTVGEKISLPAFIAALAKAGYVRHRTTVNAGSFRVRGEAIDVRHPLLAGYYSIITYGQTIERIVHHNSDSRTNSINAVRLPPLKFPTTNSSWQPIFANSLVWRPQHSSYPAGKYNIIFDSPAPRRAFPVREGAELAPAHQRIFALYQNKDRVKTHLQQRWPPVPVVLLRSPLADSAINFSSNNWQLVTESWLLPTPHPAAPIDLSSALELVSQLEEGKPAVHADHGIGIYEGLQRRALAGQAREYLVIRYAAGDALSVPVEYAHKVTAYAGQDTPPIYRLGTSIWSKVKKKAQVNAAVFAKELLDVSARRRSAGRPAYQIDLSVEREAAAGFPWQLTAGQEQAWQEVKSDLRQPHPMDRLIVGDVGFGKTEIAIRAAYHAIHNGKQVAVIAPTTLLVQQHTDTFRQRLPKIADSIFVLSRFAGATAKQQARAAMADGSAKIVIGTHALLYKMSSWKNLGLVIIDEEQRFGVKQKEYFKKIRAAVDVLSLSATPIPRTLAMALSGLRSLSLISTPPASRKSVETYSGRANSAILSQAIRRELERGGQIYVVAPRIRYLSAIQADLKKLFPQARLAIAHGQQPDSTLSQIIHKFDSGEIDILISSSIVENGLDLPNVNTMIVWQAPHFGLAELYQLRGRIGRRQRRGYAYFLYNQEQLTDIQRQRLTAITESTRLGSGWALARRDLEMRGGGNLLGPQQSGTINSVGVALYLELVQQSVANPEQLSDVDIQLPLPALLPADYMLDADERTRWYSKLSRADSLPKLRQSLQQLTSQYGPLPEAARSLATIISLQIVARSKNITKIHYRTISPPDETAYQRLIVETPDALHALSALGTLGKWVIRSNSLQLDVTAISQELVNKLVGLLASHHQ